MTAPAIPPLATQEEAAARGVAFRYAPLRRSFSVLPVALAVALFQGIGGALEKKGIGVVTQRMGEDHVTWDVLRSRFPELLATALTTPTFMLGVFMALVLGGVALTVLLSMGDAAKSAIFTGALTSIVYVLANVLINGETLGPVHLAGIAVCVAGSALIACGGLRPQ